MGHFNVGRLRISVDFLFLALVTLALLTDASGLVGMAMLCCVLHECGHLLAFCLCKATPEELALEATGICIRKAEQVLTPGKEAFVQLSGSAVNFAMAIAFASEGITHRSLFALMHLLLGSFQLLPLSTLDGGKLLRLILRNADPYRAHRICRAADLMGRILLAGCGIGLLLRNFHSAERWLSAAFLVLPLGGRIRHGE